MPNKLKDDALVFEANFNPKHLASDEALSPKAELSTLGLFSPLGNTKLDIGFKKRKSGVGDKESGEDLPTNRDNGNSKDTNVLKKFASTSAILGTANKQERDLRDLDHKVRRIIKEQIAHDTAARVKVIGRVPEVPPDSDADDPEFEFEDNGLTRVRLRASLDANGLPHEAKSQASETQSEAESSSGSRSETSSDSSQAVNPVQPAASV